jgi:7,8-dihydropterin-6-yl-methyl-4-(beta-D-ribofuranosyl)aminobenzene 5'-phosphate synthase
MRVPRALFVLLSSCIAVACAGAPSAAQPTTPVAHPATPAPRPPAARETASTVKVTSLSTMLADLGVGEWGFSALVEHDGQAILFDTGRFPDTVLRNAETLHVDLSLVTDVVLSHNHGDHTGGLVALRRAVMAKNPNALSRAHVAPPIFWSRPAPSGETNSMLATKRDYEALGGTFVEHRGFEHVGTGVYLTGLVPRTYPEKNYGSPGKGGTPGKIGTVVTPDGPADDNVPEDMALVIETPKGLVVVVGCAHAGIVNTLEYAVKETGEPHVYAAIGGVHLFRASAETLAWTAEKLAPMQLAYFVGAHCTGIEATYQLRSLLHLDRSTAVVGAVGATFDLAGGLDPGDIAR